MLGMVISKVSRDERSCAANGMHPTRNKKEKRVILNLILRIFENT